ncbi:MAG: hypothetical protein JWM09_1525 [Francisellaceae bacterium]|nr:hypothetical protein [Francisellaceae bacterium]
MWKEIEELSCEAKVLTRKSLKYINNNKFHSVQVIILNKNKNFQTKLYNTICIEINNFNEGAFKKAFAFPFQSLIQVINDKKQATNNNSILLKIHPHFFSQKQLEPLFKFLKEIAKMPMDLIESLKENIQYRILSNEESDFHQELENHLSSKHSLSAELLLEKVNILFEKALSIESKYLNDNLFNGKVYSDLLYTLGMKCREMNLENKASEIFSHILENNCYSDEITIYKDDSHEQFIFLTPDKKDFLNNDFHQLPLKPSLDSPTPTLEFCGSQYKRERFFSWNKSPLDTIPEEPYENTKLEYGF